MSSDRGGVEGDLEVAERLASSSGARRAQDQPHSEQEQHDPCQPGTPGAPPLWPAPWRALQLTHCSSLGMNRETIPNRGDTGDLTGRDDDQLAFTADDWPLDRGDMVVDGDVKRVRIGANPTNSPPDSSRNRPIGFRTLAHLIHVSPDPHCTR